MTDSACGSSEASGGPPFRWRLARDAKIFVRATVTNQIARLSPRFYARLTGETGRGRGEETADSVAAYFAECFRDYQQVLTRTVGDTESLLAGATVLEYGPGDLPAAGLLFAAHGATRVFCVDRFPLVIDSDFNQHVLDALEHRLAEDDVRRRYRGARIDFYSTPASGAAGGDVAGIDYIVDSNGYSRLKDEVDLAFSRAALEHVNDLRGTFHDMYRALKAGGIGVHKVDLRSHGLHRATALDFLTWPTWMWRLMHSCKGSPNRWRVERYRDCAHEAGFQVLLLEPVELFRNQDVEAVRHALSTVARDTSPEDLAVATFWLVLRKPA